MGGMIDDGSDGGDLDERPALLAEIIDDPRLRRAKVGGRRGIAGLEADDPRRQFGLRKLCAGRAEHADRPEAEEGAGIDGDGHGRGVAVAVAFGGAGEAVNVRWTGC